MEKFIKVKQATKQGWIACQEGGVADLSYPTSKFRRGRVQDGGQICPTITTTGGLYRLSIESENYRIRKLTERECFVLQGFTAEDCDKCKDISVSRSQLYKQIGNGICVNCVELLFEHLYKSQYDPNFVCYDEVMTAN